MKPLALALPVLLILPRLLSAATAPDELRVTLPLIATNSIELSWDDNSDDEDDFEYEISTNGGADWISLGTARRNQTIVSSLTGGVLGATYHFRVRARSTVSGNSPWSAMSAATFPSSSVPIAIVSKAFRGGQVGVSMSEDPPTVLVDSGATVTYSATDLPPGMTLAPSTGVISGTPTTGGVFRPILTVTEGTGEASTFVTFRIIPAAAGPRLYSPIPVQDLSAGSPGNLDLSEHLDDPDSTDAVRIDTNLGPLDTILYSSATPASVENFLGYVDRGDYTDVIFHRSVTNATAGVEVIQAGLMSPSGAGYATFPHDPDVINEPGISNLAGTIAMAKQGGDPNSGSSQWYFNSTANTNLDPPSQNGGFTVFGRAGSLSLPVIAEIWSRPVGTYTVDVDGSPSSFTNWPTKVAPAGATPALEELILINSASRIDPLSHTVTGNSAPGLLATSLAAGELTLTPSTIFGTVPVGPVTAEVGIQSTDLDGNALTSTIEVALTGETCDHWSATQSFPGGEDAPLDNPDHDLLPNLLEYAFDGDPAVPDDVSLLTTGIFNPGGTFSIRFPHRKFSADLTYKVQRSTNLSTWSTIWQTSDGLTSPLVIGQSDHGDTWTLTIEDPTSGSSTTFLRIHVTKTS